MDTHDWLPRRHGGRWIQPRSTGGGVLSPRPFSTTLFVSPLFLSLSLFVSCSPSHSRGTATTVARLSRRLSQPSSPLFSPLLLDGQLASGRHWRFCSLRQSGQELILFLPLDGWQVEQVCHGADVCWNSAGDGIGGNCLGGEGR